MASKRIGGGLIGFCLSLFLTMPAAAQLAECDRLAASTLDRTRPAGVPGVPADQIDASKALPACEKALIKSPNEPRIKFQLARALSKAGKDLERQATLNREAAERGNLLAAHNLATQYEAGSGVRPDQVAAAGFYRQAAQGGVLLSMLPLADHLLNGIGIEKNEIEAVAWYRKAAEGGDINAFDKMANGYVTGLGGLQRDDVEALRWFRRAATAGSEQSKRFLAGLEVLEAMKHDELISRQRQLADARCYHGPLDGKVSTILQKAVADCPDMRPVLRIETGMHVASINRISADANCRFLATGSADNTVRLWDMPRGQLIRTQRFPQGGHWQGAISAVAVSPNAELVAAGGIDVAVEVFQRMSVYLFDSVAGIQVRRLGTFDDTIVGLAFSPDGRRLAVALWKKGIRVLDVATGKELMADRDFFDKVGPGLAFGPDGTLYAVGYDGFLRRYGPDLNSSGRSAIVGGKRPHSVAVDPAGQILAIGFVNSSAVEFYDAPSLRWIDTGKDTGVERGNLASVAWSQDGTRLLAAGELQQAGRTIIRRFTAKGRRDDADVPVAGNTIYSLVPCGEGVGFGTGEPSFGVIRKDGTMLTLMHGHGADLRRNIADVFTVSTDGTRLQFSVGASANDNVMFDLTRGTLERVSGAASDLAPPDTTGLPVTDWLNSTTPRFKGTLISLGVVETSRALAVRSDKAGFVMGMASSLRAFDAAGQARWSLGALATAWGVNLARGGNLVIAAYGDGTIRWHRWSDGKELLALFVNKDTRAWVAWTPSGYYTASPGGEDMIGWHVNRGWEQPADFFPASKFREQYARPDIVERVLDTMDETEAVNQA